MSALKSILANYRNASATEREKGNYFEELISTYFRYEATYRDLYSEVWLYNDWAKAQGLDGRAYNYTKHFPERKEMMQTWAGYLDRLKSSK